MRFTENRSEEIRAMVTVVDGLLTKNKANNYEHLKWFYDQVADLVERQEQDT